MSAVTEERAAPRRSGRRPRPSSFTSGAWMADANCAQMSPRFFFVGGDDPANPWREARRACLACPVRSECEEAMKANGLRGGVYAAGKVHR